MGENPPLVDVSGPEDQLVGDFLLMGFGIRLVPPNPREAGAVAALRVARGLRGKHRKRLRKLAFRALALASDEDESAEYEEIRVPIHDLAYTVERPEPRERLP